MSKCIETGQERREIAKYASVRILHNSKFIIRYSIFEFSLPPSWGHPDTTCFAGGVFIRDAYRVNIMKSSHAVLVLIVLFVIVSAISWGIWPNPVIDGGREMNTPLRMLRGETLYSQIYYLYGPVAPVFNTLLYKLFGVHLTVLYAAGLAGSLALVLMIFYLANKFMTAYEALLAAATVIIFSLFKQEGNLVFPYTYSVLYGTLIGTLALIAQIRHVRSHRTTSLFVAGALSGLALCCKFEFGFAAIISLIALAVSAPRGQRTRIALIGLGSFAIFPLLIYGLVFSRIPADSILKDTYILPGYMPAELIHYNMLKLGLNHPGKTVREMINAAALLGGCFGVTLLAGVRMTGESIAYAAANPRLRRIWQVTLLCWGLMLAHLLIFGTRWDLNPLRALPLLILGIVWFIIIKPDSFDGIKEPKRSLLVICAYGLAVLARIVFRIPANGALLPVPLLLLIFVIVALFPAFSISTTAARHTRRIVSSFLTISLFAFLGIISYRHHVRFDYWLHTPRGDMRLRHPLGVAMRQTLDFISRNSKPGEYIIGLPEGGSLNFLSDRPVPLRYEILTPGFLTKAAEEEAIRQIKEKNVKLIFMFNRTTAEFGAEVFGRDYYQTLMGYINSHYTLAAVFGPDASPETQLGDAAFFIKCYALRQ
jgi:hypothetical protein